MREVEDNKMSRLFNDLFIFEMANSHQGDVEHGKDIIHEMGKIARKYNINAAVKLQYRNLDNFIQNRCTTCAKIYEHKTYI